MRRLAKRLVILGAFAGVGTLLYRYALNDEAKRALKTAAQSVEDAYEAISDRIHELYGSEMSEDVDELQQDVSRQWEKLGF